MVIRARVFQDLVRNGNNFGKRNAGDPWLNGWLLNVATSPAVTIANGPTTPTTAANVYEARFTNLPPGNYAVCVTVPSGWTSSEPATPDQAYGKPCKSVNLTAGQSAYLLFGVYQQEVTASELLHADELITDVDQVSDLPMEPMEEETLVDDEATANRRLFLPLIAR